MTITYRGPLVKSSYIPLSAFGPGEASTPNHALEEARCQTTTKTTSYMPIGIIKKSTGAGTTIRLIPPHPSAR